MLIVREAGGLVEAVEPGADPLLAGTILAANEPIFDSFAKVIRNL
jgi:myo-inositol-1(or 4)-monophosphatase